MNYFFEAVPLECEQHCLTNDYKPCHRCSLPSSVKYLVDATEYFEHGPYICDQDLQEIGRAVAYCQEHDLPQLLPCCRTFAQRTGSDALARLTALVSQYTPTEWQEPEPDYDYNYEEYDTYPEQAYVDCDTAEWMPSVQEYDQQCDFSSSSSNCRPSLGQNQPYYCCQDVDESSLQQEETDIPCEQEAKPHPEPAIASDPTVQGGNFLLAMLDAAQPDTAEETLLYGNLIAQLKTDGQKSSECVTSYAWRCIQTFTLAPGFPEAFQMISFTEGLLPDLRPLVLAKLVDSLPERLTFRHTVQRAYYAELYLGINLPPSPDTEHCRLMDFLATRVPDTVEACVAQDSQAYQDHSGGCSATVHSADETSCDTSAAVAPDNTFTGTDETLSSAWGCSHALTAGSDNPILDTDMPSSAIVCYEESEAASSTEVEEIIPAPLDTFTSPASTAVFIFIDDIALPRSSAVEFRLLAPEILSAFSAISSSIILYTPVQSINHSDSAAHGTMQALLELPCASDTSLSCDPFHASIGLEPLLQQEPFFSLSDNCSASSADDPFAASFALVATLELPCEDLDEAAQASSSAAISAPADKLMSLLTIDMHAMIVEQSLLMESPAVLNVTGACAMHIWMNLPDALMPLMIILDDLPQPTDTPPPLSAAQGVLEEACAACTQTLADEFHTLRRMHLLSAQSALHLMDGDRTIFAIKAHGNGTFHIYIVPMQKPGPRGYLFVLASCRSGGQFDCTSHPMERQLLSPWPCAYLDLPADDRLQLLPHPLTGVSLPIKNKNCTQLRHIAF